MNNKLRKATKIIISILILIAITSIDLKIPLTPITSEPIEECCFNCFCDPPFVDFDLGPIVTFFSSWILIFLFNKYLLTKQSKTDKEIVLQPVVSRILVSALIFILVGIVAETFQFPVSSMLDQCEQTPTVYNPHNYPIDYRYLLEPCSSYYLFRTIKIPDQLYILINWVFFPGIFVLLFNIIFREKKSTEK